MEDYQLLKAELHFRRVPLLKRGLAKDLFLTYRNEAAKIYEKHILKVKSEWDKTGKPMDFGPYLEDVNPEYGAFVREKIQPIIDAEVNKPERLVRIYIDDYGVLMGQWKGNEKSKIYVIVEEP